MCLEEELSFSTFFYFDFYQPQPFLPLLAMSDRKGPYCESICTTEIPSFPQIKEAKMDDYIILFFSGGWGEGVDIN
jgi:hypothetical protein